jgi:hypothetical protein
VSKLKAFVRFDATGRIIPGSLILRAQAPKVGKWVEVDAYECCNYVPATTTTTTTAAPIPFREKIYAAFKNTDACKQQLGTEFSALGNGTTFCNSTTLTAAGFSALPPGELFISYGGQVRASNHGAGQNFVTFTTGCSDCPQTK